MLQGGHGSLNNICLAFNESGDVNKIAQWLEVGDEIEFMGLEHEGDYHLEAIKVTIVNHCTKTDLRMWKQNEIHG